MLGVFNDVDELGLGREPVQGSGVDFANGGQEGSALGEFVGRKLLLLEDLLPVFGGQASSFVGVGDPPSFVGELLKGAIRDPVGHVDGRKSLALLLASSPGFLFVVAGGGAFEKLGLLLGLEKNRGFGGQSAKVGVGEPEQRGQAMRLFGFSVPRVGDE